MTTRQRYDEDTKAAVMADTLALGAGATAAKYGVPYGTVRSWISRSNPVATLKKEHIGALIANYLEANLQALTAQAYVASQPEYIDRQSAEHLAVLHGVMADKSIRLLEAASRQQAASEAAQLEADE